VSTPSRTRSLRRFLQETAAGTVASLRGHDLLLYAAGLTFYAALGLVPLLLLASKAATLVLSPESVAAVGRRLGAYAGQRLGLDRAAEQLVVSGSRLRPSAVVAAVVPASLYSEGFVRAFDRLSARGRRRNRTARGRLFAPLLFAASTLALVVALAVGGSLAGSLGRGPGARVLGIYLAFLLLWVLSTGVLALLYRVFSSERPAAGALVLGAAATGSFLAGMSLGFVLVVRLATGVGTPYGGNAALGAASVLGFLLYLSHIVVLVGFALTLRLDARWRTPVVGVAARLVEALPAGVGQ